MTIALSFTLLLARLPLLLRLRDPHVKGLEPVRVYNLSPFKGSLTKAGDHTGRGYGHVFFPKTYTVYAKNLSVFNRAVAEHQRGPGQFLQQFLRIDDHRLRHPAPQVLRTPVYARIDLFPPRVKHRADNPPLAARGIFRQHVQRGNGNQRPAKRIRQHLCARNAHPESRVRAGTVAYRYKVYVFGLKSQRGRISLAPVAEHWTALTVTGCLTRRVIDTALWMDVAQGAVPGDRKPPPPPDRPYVEAAGADPGKLRIAWSVKAPRAVAPPIVTDSVKGAVADMVETLRALGHHVEHSDPKWGQLGNGAVPRYLQGIADEVAEVPNPERLEPRTHAMARLAGRIPKSVLRRAHTAEARDAARINAIFERFDVLMIPTVGEPPVPVRKWNGKGALRTLVGMSRTYPFGIPFNYTGQPAAAVPAGFTADGLPLSVQLVAPPNGEDRLFSLSAQLEAELRWYEHRPPICDAPPLT